MQTDPASKQEPSDMLETTPRLGFIELNVAAEIFASERDLLRATYKGTTLVDVAILQGSAQTATQLARHGVLPQQLSLNDLVINMQAATPCFDQDRLRVALFAAKISPGVAG